MGYSEHDVMTTGHNKSGLGCLRSAPPTWAQRGPNQRLAKPGSVRSPLAPSPHARFVLPLPPFTLPALLILSINNVEYIRCYYTTVEDRTLSTLGPLEQSGPGEQGPSP